VQADPGNIDRYEQTGMLDTDYLLSLSPDVEPALQRLPQEVRQCAMYRDDDPDAWYEFNLSRSRVTSASTQSGDSCEAYWTSSS
jgi:hypothetical protein